MHTLRGIIFLIIADIVFGIMPILVKLAYTTGLTVIQVNFLCSGAATVMLGIFIRYSKISFHLKRPQLAPMLLSTILGYTAAVLTLYCSYQYVSAGVATSLHYLFPVMVMLLTYFLYHEKLQIYKWLSVLIALSGIYLIADPSGSSFSVEGVGLAVSSAVFFAIYLLSLNHPQLKVIDSLVLAFYACLVRAMVSLVILVAQGDGVPKLTMNGLYYIGLLSFFCTTLGLILYIKGTQIIGSVNASILSTVEPGVSIVAGSVILSEPLSWNTTLGCVLIIAAVIQIGYTNLSDRFRELKALQVNK